MKYVKVQFVTLAAVAALMSACGGSGASTETTESAAPMEIYKPKAAASALGVGPITSEIQLEPINADMAKQGEELFTSMCTACHKMDKRHVGPGLKGVIERRNPTWVMNMILDPEKMVAEDPVAKALLAEYLSPMANQNLTQDQARAVLEYFRQYDEQNP